MALFETLLVVNVLIYGIMLSGYILLQERREDDVVDIEMNVKGATSSE